jgi:hypothetical protein
LIKHEVAMKLKGTNLVVYVLLPATIILTAAIMLISCPQAGLSCGKIGSVVEMFFPMQALLPANYLSGLYFGGDSTAAFLIFVPLSIGALLVFLSGVRAIKTPWKVVTLYILTSAALYAISILALSELLSSPPPEVIEADGRTTQQ